jgi:hypothetical protein
VILEYDTAASGLGREDRVESFDTQPVDDAAHEPFVHPAHEIGRGFGQRVEWAVREHDPLALVDEWFETDIGQDLDRPVGVGRPSSAGAGIFGADPATFFGRDAHRGVVGRLRRSGLGDRAREEAAGELVATGGDVERDLGCRRDVTLGRAPGTGAAAAGRPRVVGDEQARVEESLEVEGGQAAGDAAPARNLVACDGPVRTPHEQVDRAPLRLVEDGVPLRLLLEPLEGHAGTLTPMPTIET